MNRAYIIFLLQCMLLAASCNSNHLSLEEKTDIVSFSTLNIQFTGNASTRAIDSKGYDGVVKKEFVNGDVVKFYKDDDATPTCIATYNGTEWNLDAALQLITGRRTVVKIVFYNMATNSQEAHAIAVYDKDEWVTTADGCWGEISSDANGLSAVLKYTNSLICIDKITSAVGDIQSIKAIVDDTEPAMVEVTGKNWLYETIGTAGKNLTKFLVTLSDNTEVEVPLTTVLPLVANTQYPFQLYLLPGEITVTIGEPASWDPAGNIGLPSMITITSLDDMKDEYGNYIMNGKFIMANDIQLTTEHTPIGTIDNPFVGELDGNGYSIIGLRIKSDSPEDIIDYAGLFGVLGEGAVVKNIHFEDSKIETTGIAAGILAGYAKVGARFDQCSVKGYDPDKQSNIDAGKGKNSIAITAKEGIENVYAGGLIGHIVSTGGIASFSRSWVTYTDITASISNSVAFTHCGGLIGRAENVTVISSYTYFTYCTASSAATSHYIGGFIGSSYNDSKNPYCSYGCNAREISALAYNATNNSAGDFIGYAQGKNDTEKAKIVCCYATKNDIQDIGLFIQTKQYIEDPENSWCVGHTTDLDKFDVLNDATDITYNGKVWKANKIWVIPHENGKAGFPYVNLSYNGE